MIRGWDKVDPRSDFYKEATGLDGSVPFHFFESDDPVPADIDSRFGPWDTKWPKPPKGKKYFITPEGLKELVWDDLDGECRSCLAFHKKFGLIMVFAWLFALRSEEGYALCFVVCCRSSFRERSVARISK